MAQHKESDGEARPIVRDYLILSQAALLILTLILVEEGFGWWSVLPLLLGSFCLAASWSIGPPLVLLSLTSLRTLRVLLVGFSEEPSELMELAAAGVTLIYLAGSMRLLSLIRHTVPPDFRRSRNPPGTRLLGRWLLPANATLRSGRGIAPNEILVLLVAAPLFVVVAYLVWFRLAVEPPPDWMDAPLVLYVPFRISLNPFLLWRVVLLVWVSFMALATGYSFLAYLGRVQAGPEESLLYLQDQLWTATRGEQRRINRWLVWGRLREQRKEEGR